jgi:osmoprotectant transport system permease protein
MDNALGSKILEHLLISVVPLVVGLVLGGGLGALCALLIRLVFSALPWSRNLAILLPWRTVLVGLVLLLGAPFLVTRLGLGVTTAAISVGLILFLLTLVTTIGLLVEHWHPSALGVRVLAGIRMLATASGAIAAGVGFMSGGGLGFLILQGMRLLNYELAWQGVLAVVILALVLDSLVGVVQLVLAYIIGSKKEDEQTDESNHLLATA